MTTSLVLSFLKTGNSLHVILLLSIFSIPNTFLAIIGYSLSILRNLVSMNVYSYRKKKCSSHMKSLRIVRSIILPKSFLLYFVFCGQHKSESILAISLLFIGLNFRVSHEVHLRSPQLYPLSSLLVQADFSFFTQSLSLFWEDQSHQKL
jgi:hypothetical protein